MKRLLPLLLLSACVTAPAPTFPTIGSIDNMDRGILASGAQIEDLGGEFGWSEGPVWIEDGYLLFTDVPGNSIWKFTETDGLSLWMLPSGSKTQADYTSSPGANGLFPYGAGKILVPDHGNRALYVMDVETQVKTVLADTYEGKRFNSPNDVVVHSSGMIYFTDPPYGLKDQDDNPAKDLDFNGVFALSPDGELTVIDRTLTRPNGIALSPDGRTLYVANSDPVDSKFITYPVAADGTVGTGSLFLDVSTERESEGFGNPDGMAVATDGTIFATGPGGVWVISPEGEKLGIIRTGKPVANVAFGDADRKTLYMTSYNRLTRIRTRKTGL
jgi:gluconolactonase